MAQSEHLPIYKRSYDLCLYLEQVVRGFPRYQKYTLGADLREGARRVLKLIVRANARRDKAPVLLEMREELEALKVVLRLCQDVRHFLISTPCTPYTDRAGRNDETLNTANHGPRRRAHEELLHYLEALQAA